jgi:hypothetical protein
MALVSGRVHGPQRRDLRRLGLRRMTRPRLEPPCQICKWRPSGAAAATKRSDRVEVDQADADRIQTSLLDDSVKPTRSIER